MKLSDITKELKELRITFIDPLTGRFNKINEYWLETGMGAIALTCLALAISLEKNWMLYVLASLTGFLAGRYFYVQKSVEKGFLMPTLLLSFGFIIGFTLGSFEASRKAVVFLFILFYLISYSAHKQKLLSIFQTEGFIR